MADKIAFGIQIVLSLVFVGSGFAKLTRQPKMKEEFARWNLSQNFMLFIGACEVLGVVGFWGGQYVYPPIRVLATIGLSIIMMGAVYTHVKAKDGIKGFAPAAVFLVLLLALLFLIPMPANASGKRMTTNVVHIAHLSAKAGREKDLEKRLENVSIASRAEKGCIDYVWHKLSDSTDGKSTYYSYERWETQEALTKHTQTEHFKAFFALEAKDSTIDGSPVDLTMAPLN